MEKDNTAKYSCVKQVKAFVYLPILIGLATSILTLLMKLPENSFISQWLPYYGVALLIVLPLAIRIIDRLNEVIEEYLPAYHLIIKGLAFCLPFAAVFGSLVIGIAVVRFTPDFKVYQFYSLWGRELIKSLPVFLAIGLFAGVIIKPMLDTRKNKTN